MNKLVSEPLPPENSNERRWLETRPGEQCFIHVSADDTNGLYSLVEIVANPGDATPLHVHQREDEHFLVVEGTARIAYGDRVFDLQAGKVATLRKGIPHAWGNRTNADLRLAVLVFPRGCEEALRLIAEDKRGRRPRCCRKVPYKAARPNSVLTPRKIKLSKKGAKGTAL
jgi:mannose-6-phosphate isomerase-like protein (cupin superfamily)